MNDRIVLVGAGNMATAIAYALKEGGNAPVAVWSRTLESAATLGGRVGCAFTDDLASLPAADIVIISVADNALRDVAMSVSRLFPLFILYFKSQTGSS
jgi:glutamyl-tRNA reductase